MNLSGEMIAFVLLALVAITGGLLLIYLTKVVHMVVAGVFSFISIAGIYVMLSAEFVAGVQILIYSGAITIMMLFGIMLTKQHDRDAEKTSALRKLFVLIGIIAFAVIVYLGIYRLDIPYEAVPLHEENTKQVGIELYSNYVIPFELTSVLLLVALVGAVILAKREEKEEAEK